MNKKDIHTPRLSDDAVDSIVYCALSAQERLQNPGIEVKDIEGCIEDLVPYADRLKSLPPIIGDLQRKHLELTGKEYQAKPKNPDATIKLAAHVAFAMMHPYSMTKH